MKLASASWVKDLPESLFSHTWSCSLQAALQRFRAMRRSSHTSAEYLQLTTCSATAKASD